MSSGKINKEVTHPLEDLFDLPSASTVITVHKRESELVACDDFDTKDQEIEQQFQDVYDTAMDAFDNINSNVESSEFEPKYIVAQMDLASRYLTTALAAAREKSNLKAGKDKIKAADSRIKTKANSGTQGITMSHTELLKLINGDKPPAETIEGVFTDVDDQ